MSIAFCIVFTQFWYGIQMSVFYLGIPKHANANYSYTCDFSYNLCSNCIFKKVLASLQASKLFWNYNPACHGQWYSVELLAWLKRNWNKLGIAVYSQSNSGCSDKISRASKVIWREILPPHPDQNFLQSSFVSSNIFIKNPIWSLYERMSWTLESRSKI